jgi:flagellin
MTSINTNVNALFAQSSLSANTVAQTTAMQQLSTGLRINSAKDDAAGLAIATRMNSNVRGVAVAIRNANDGISMAQTAESSLGSVVNMLQRMRELAVQSVNGTLTSQNRANMQIEVGQLVNEIDNISKKANFNGIKLFDGSAASVVLQTNVSTGDVVKMGIGLMNSRTLGLGNRSAMMAQGFEKSGTATGGAGVAPNSLGLGISSGDLVINGIVIGSSIAADDSNSFSDKESSAISKVAAINRSTAQTGVMAEINQTVASGIAMTAGTAGASGTITINGVSTSVVTLKGNLGQDRSQVVNAINAISGQTGVKAVDTGSDFLGVQMIAADGRNITAYATSSSGNTGTFDAASIGIDVPVNAGVAPPATPADPNTVASAIFTGTYSLQSTTNSPITIGTQVTGNLSHSGLSTGIYQANTSYVTTQPRGNANTANVGQANGSYPLQAGDLVINGVAIPASIATDDTASDASSPNSNKAASAIAIAAAINKVSSQTGVNAVANPNILVGTGFAATAGDKGNLYINGVAVNINVTAATKAIDIVNAINQVSGTSGVVAADNGSGITLTAADGRNVSLYTDATGTLSLNDLGLNASSLAHTNAQDPYVTIGAADNTTATVNYAGVSLVSSKTFTVAGGARSTAIADLAALGLNEGTYGGSNNGVKIGDMDISTVQGANDALSAVDAALSQISDMRSNLGAIQNRLTSAIDNLTSSQTNMQQSVSRIQDTDYGTATTALSRAQIINQAATAMLAQANQQSQLVLQLLK